MAVTTSPCNISRGFSRVVLTLDNVFIPFDKLTNTPSMQDALDYETEIDLRNYGCELIQTAGVLLKLPQVAMATGQVLFQRYYYSRSFVRHNMEITAIAAVHLASKIEEAPRRIRDCLNVFHHMKQVKTGRTIGPMVLDQNYVNIKNEVIKAERRCLKELGFCVHVKHPHKMIVTILRQLEQQNNQRLVQFAWNYMNDSFRTDVFMRFSPAVIASACIFLAARQLQVPLPNSPPWYYVFDANDEQVQEIALTLLRLYARPKVNWDKLENAVADAKRKLRDAQIKERLAKDMAAGVPSFGEDGNSPILLSSESNAANPSTTAAEQVTLTGQQPSSVANADTTNIAQISDGVAPTSESKGSTRTASPPVAYRKHERKEDAGDSKSQKKRRARESKSRSKSPRHRKSSKHRRHHRHRRHSSTSPGGGSSSRSSSRSSRASSVTVSSSDSSHHRSSQVNNGARDRKHDKSSKYENGDDRTRKDSKRHHDRNYRGGHRSRSRSASIDGKHRRRDHREDSRARERSSASVHKSSGRDGKRSSPRPRDAGNHVSSRHQGSGNSTEHHR